MGSPPVRAVAARHRRTPAEPPAGTNKCGDDLHLQTIDNHGDVTVYCPYIGHRMWPVGNLGGGRIGISSHRQAQDLPTEEQHHLLALHDLQGPGWWLAPV